MKKQILSALILCLAATLFAEGKLLKAWNFETSSKMQVYPANSVLELDDEEFHQGKKSLVFTPDNNCCVYFWQKVTAGTKYTVTFWYKTDKAPIKRCGMTINFKTADGKNISQHQPLADVCQADNAWHEARFEFTAPEGAVNSQVVLNFLRCNTTVFIDEFRFYDESVQIETAALPTEPVSKGKLVRACTFENMRNIYRDPKGDFVTLKDETLGKNYLSFTADVNYSAYFYLTVQPGKEYQAEFLYRIDGDILQRCGFTLFYTSKGAKRGDLGMLHISAKDLKPSNGKWAHGTFKFKAPEKIHSCQFIINFFRCNVNADIADLRIFEEP